MKYLRKFLHAKCPTKADSSESLDVSAVSVSSQGIPGSARKQSWDSNPKSGFVSPPHSIAAEQISTNPSSRSDGKLELQFSRNDIFESADRSPTPPTPESSETGLSPDALISEYKKRFVNRDDIWNKQLLWPDGRFSYCCQKPSMDTKGGRFPYEPVTLDLVALHILGEITCSWPAIDENGYGRWICFDSDEADGKLDVLHAFLLSWQWNVLREGRRQGRDGHLWILFDSPIDAKHLCVLADAMMRHAGVSGFERFPKSSTKLSQVRGPLGVHLKPGANNARGWFDGVEHNLIAQLEWLALQPLNSAADAVIEAVRQKPIPVKVVRSVPKLTGRRYDHSIKILEMVNSRQVGNEFLAQCPLCKSEGHDDHEDNLRISLDGEKFCCVFGGPGQVHKTKDIICFLEQK